MTVTAAKKTDEYVAMTTETEIARRRTTTNWIAVAGDATSNILAVVLGIPLLGTTTTKKARARMAMIQ